MDRGIERGRTRESRRRVSIAGEQVRNSWGNPNCGKRGGVRASLREYGSCGKRCQRGWTRLRGVMGHLAAGISRDAGSSRGATSRCGVWGVVAGTAEMRSLRWLLIYGCCGWVMKTNERSVTCTTTAVTAGHLAGLSHGISGSYPYPPWSFSPCSGCLATKSICMNKGHRRAHWRKNLRRLPAETLRRNAHKELAIALSHESTSRQGDLRFRACRSGCSSEPAVDRPDSPARSNLCGSKAS